MRQQIEEKYKYKENDKPTCRLCNSKLEFNCLTYCKNCKEIIKKLNKKNKKGFWIGTCIYCGRNEIILHSKKSQICITCYKKYFWEQKLKSCRDCGEFKKIHAKGLCPKCYKKTIPYNIKRKKLLKSSAKRFFNLDLKTYLGLTKKCLLCDFDKSIHIHHFDENKNNNDIKNLIPLCPNHHALIHILKYKKEVKEEINNFHYY